MDSFQARDRREQAERAAIRSLDQLGIGAGQRGKVALFDVRNDQDLAVLRIVKGARRIETLGREIEVLGARTGFGGVPIFAAFQRRRSHD